MRQTIGRESMSFKCGDKVKLASGGPTMTIKCPVGGNAYTLIREQYSSAGHPNTDFICEWFDKNQELQRNAFPLAMLVSAEADGK